MEREGSGLETEVFREPEIADDRLRLMFVCCHPQIPAEAQVALALKTLCGFSVAEISRAFLTTDAAIAKRLTRAKQRIREAGIAFEIPGGEELARRLDGVLQSLYLLFSEGYKASSGGKLVREDICMEAIRLTGLLVEHPAGHRPKVHALLALMWLNAARLSTRVDGEGNLLRLQEQDRRRWNPGMMARGMFHLSQSAGGDELTEYHLQAGIAACHFRKSLQLAEIKSEQKFLARRLQACESKLSPAPAGQIEAQEIGAEVGKPSKEWTNSSVTARRDREFASGAPEGQRDSSPG
jgi:RNA polymerase sigma-70 factor (ECF subfamily)